MSVNDVGICHLCDCVDRFIEVLLSHKEAM